MCELCRCVPGPGRYLVVEPRSWPGTAMLRVEVDMVWRLGLAIAVQRERGGWRLMVSSPMEEIVSFEIWERLG